MLHFKNPPLLEEIPTAACVFLCSVWEAWGTEGCVKRVSCVVKEESKIRLRTVVVNLPALGNLTRVLKSSGEIAEPKVWSLCLAGKDVNLSLSLKQSVEGTLLFVICPSCLIQKTQQVLLKYCV